MVEEQGLRDMVLVSMGVSHLRTRATAGAFLYLRSAQLRVLSSHVNSLRNISFPRGLEVEGEGGECSLRT